jgi:hypothetical protein
MLPGESSMTCEKPIQIHDNRYGREMVGDSAGFEPALPAISNLSLSSDQRCTQLLCATISQLDFRFRVAGEFKEENKFVKLIF